VPRRFFFSDIPRERSADVSARFSRRTAKEKTARFRDGSFTPLYRERFIPTVREKAARNGEFDGIGGRFAVISAIASASPREKVARGLSPHERPPLENEIRE